MGTGTKTALVLSSDPALAESLAAPLSARGYKLLRAGSIGEAKSAMAREPFGLVFFAAQEGERNISLFLADGATARGHGARLRWVVCGVERGAEGAEIYFSLGAFATLPSRPRPEQVSELLDNLDSCAQDPLLEIMQMVEGISGVQLKKGKRSLAETRLGKRIRKLGLRNVEEYLHYFHRHPKKEAEEIISLFTTHTTNFFREGKHYDHLYEKVLPGLFASGQKEIRIWSAACSSGQEAYSVAITVAEYMRENNIPGDKAPRIEIFGTDIDHSSIAAAREGVYPRTQIREVESVLASRYFDQGEGPLAHLVRVKDHLHAHCRFEKMNLLSPQYSLPPMDVIFLRNVLIYFRPADTAAVAQKINNVLKPGGTLFLGHSESLQGLENPFQSAGNSIYVSMAQKNAKKTPAAAPLADVKGIARAAPPAAGRHLVGIGTPEVIAIGASTGGVEALKTVLEGIPQGAPPILIVQHIPAGFSAALARRLNATCKITICEGEDGQVIEPSFAYIAPGRKQMRVKERSGHLCLEITDDEPVNRHKPSVDYLFQSLVPYAKKITVTAALLTGMGTDGARGLKALRDGGAHTIAQDEKSCTVFGMPKAAIELGGADEIASLKDIAQKLLQRSRLSQKAG